MISIAESIRNTARRAYVGDPQNVIEIECNDTEGSLIRLLTYIMRTGNIGHSFDIIVDPDNKEYKMSFGWDGDGADSIRNIKVNGKKVGFKDYFEKDKERSEKYLERYKKKYGKFAVADYLRYLVKAHINSKIETLYSNKFIEIQKISDPKKGVKGYFYLHEKNKGVISILPFKKEKNQIQFLLRKEITPCWSMNYNISSITGKHDQKTPILTAVKELKEEAGYEVSSKDMINLGTCRGTKSCDTIFYLFSVDLTDKKEGKATTDGSELEKNATCIWNSDVSKSVDPLSYVSYCRLTKKLDLEKR
jgi:hypothetical protein